MSTIDRILSVAVNSTSLTMESGSDRTDQRSRNTSVPGVPVEESANMLIMTAAYLQRTDVRAAKAFATTHYAILKKWAD